MKNLLTGLGLLLALAGFGQKSDSTTNFWSNWTFKPIVAGQMWVSYTEGARIYDPDSMVYEDVDGRTNFVIRRTRLGAAVAPNENFTFTLVASMDNVGRDVLAGPTGGANNGAFPNVGLWNATVQWRAIKNKELLHIVFGYHSPVFSRESISAWHSVSSLDKSFSQFYIRRHLTGKNPGRSVGVTIGGQASDLGIDNFGLQYSLGVFNSVFTSAAGNSSGSQASPLITGKVMAYFGQPESTRYKVGTRFNTLSRRRGLSIGFSASHEGANDAFDRSYAYALDALWNIGPWNIGGEWAWMRRDGKRITDQGALRTFTANSSAGFARVAYNFSLPKEQILEVGGTLMRFAGPSSEEGIQDALSVFSGAGSNTAFDLGIIWHLIPGRFKVELHGTLQDGDSGDAETGVIVNDFFAQNGVGIRRGDYVGLGVIFVL